MYEEKDKKRFDTLRQIGCIACGKSEPVIHHKKQDRFIVKPNHEDTIPLCPSHHNMGNESIHLNKSVFEKKFGTEKELLEETNVKIEQLEKEQLFYVGKGSN